MLNDTKRIALICVDITRHGQIADNLRLHIPDVEVASFFSIERLLHGIREGREFNLLIIDDASGILDSPGSLIEIKKANPDIKVVGISADAHANIGFSRIGIHFFYHTVVPLRVLRMIVVNLIEP